ncbi:small nuclear ribonucleoprotein SmD3b isoform X2 [Capsicum annuum]|uniref:small nuclear ribonucleoprotein SmD3b isoform X2 n=1 Tax=Capsicum annuum TaxID=4072 RepID=UPI0007BF5025|nr:small nuclear ribonucleoprotein SmD3b isoform X2 [Capsicum annuum]
MSRSLGIPVKLLHEATGHIVTVEMKSGELYRGSMVECEDNWNCQLESITYTARDGRVSQLEHVFIRGSKVRFMIIPDMLKNAPMFKRLEARIKVHRLELVGDVLLLCELKLRLLVVEQHLVEVPCRL